MSEAQTQTITPERQIAASQVGAVFNSLHEYLRTLEPKDPENRSTMTHQLQCAHERIDEAAMWAIKSVLTYGLPPRPASAAVPDQPAADSQPAAPTGADALPPTTPTESV